MKKHILMAAVAASLMLAGCGSGADDEAVTVTVTGSANVRDAATAEGSSVLETLSAGTELTGRWVESDTNPSEQWFEYERDGEKAYVWAGNLIITADVTGSKEKTDNADNEKMPQMDASKDPFGNEPIVEYISKQNWAENCNQPITVSWDKNRGWLLFNGRNLIQDGLRENITFYFVDISSGSFIFVQEVKPIISDYVEVADIYEIQFIDENTLEVYVTNANLNNNALYAVKNGNFSFNPRNNPTFYSGERKFRIYKRCF